MRFNGFDLNMLVALDHLLTERSVSRAAEKLLRNQSTISGVLARLREHFNDDLLVQVGREMVPTARGLELAAAARDLLLQIDARIMTAPDFDPASSERTIRIFASDYLMIAGLANAMRMINRAAPGVRFEVLQPSQLQGRQNAPDLLLENGEIDLLAMPQAYVSHLHPHAPLFAETFCCLICRDNPLIDTHVTLDEFLKMRHVTVSFGPNSAPSYEEWFTREFGAKSRKIDIVAGSFSTMPFLIAGTTRIALAHRRLAEAYTRIMPLRIIEAPVQIPPLTEVIQWHHYGATDRALIWVRDQIVSYFESGR
ncbi:LysR family transcriptional regulator [Roseinatronobacter sp.]|uniref:LysR family transcriptional regulator n=1 Tax=Roseinatronobacter sp. TaxID=1945755 RepID=UPI003F728748